MIRQVQKVRIYPSKEQKQQLPRAMGACRWGWNYALNKNIETYKETGKSLSRNGLNALLTEVKKKEETEWLKEKNLARKQQKLSRKQLGSKVRQKARKLVAKIHARISNIRQDYLHKLSRKLTNESQVVVVEDLNVRGLVRLSSNGDNHKLAKHISDSGWGTLINFLSYKLERENKRLVEIDRWFPSSHI